MTLTINELYNFCKEQINKGNGNKKILISSDDEGNSYHELFYGINENVDNFKDLIYCVDEKKLKDYVILG